MSVAGKRASQGYDYQDIIAVHWLIQLLQNNELAAIQLEIIALADESEAATVDDIVLTFKDNSIVFIQAKKNQPKYENWTFKDETLKDELLKARKQLEQTPNSKVMFYSRLPFAELQKLAEDCNTLFSSYSIFVTQAPNTLKDPLEKLANIFQRSEEESYHLVKRIDFGCYHSLPEWKSLNLQLLENKVTQPKTALAVLFNLNSRL